MSNENKMAELDEFLATVGEMTSKFKDMGQQRIAVVKILIAAAHTNGGHHKQYCIIQALKAYGVEYAGDDPGIAP